MTLDLINSFYFRILSCGLLIAMLAGPLGCLLIWRRMAFFGDAIAHSSLLGVAIGSALGCNIHYSVLTLALILSLSLGVFKQRPILSSDTHLALISHGTLAIGLMALALLPNARGEFNTFFFGDLLTLAYQDVIQISIMSLLAFILLIWYWKRFLTWILSEDIAAVEGHVVIKIRFIFFMLVGIFVASAAKAVGVLLMTSLLVIPAASARIISKSPRQMACIASIISLLSFAIGTLSSFMLDLPLAPAIVVCNLLIFGMLAIFSK